MKLRKAAALLLSLTITCSLAACGGASMEGGSTTTDSSSTETTTDAAESKDTAASTEATEATEWKWPSKDELYVGYSQADLASTWRTVESEDMQRAADERGYKITIVNAEGDSEQQLSDVESLLAQGCNVIVITAVDGDAIQPALDKCKEKGVPVIMKARGSNGTPGVDYVTFYSSDFVAEGRYAGEWAYKACTDKGLDTIKVAEIQGILGGTDVRDRSDGFHAVAEEKGNFDFVVQQTANFSRTEAQEVAANVLQSTGGDIDVFYCHNDEMALGVSLACQSAGLKINEDVYIIGVDGMYETFDAIKAGTISATITCTPKFADEVFDGIEAGMAGEKLDTFYAIEDVPVDATNVDENYDLGF